MIRIPIHQGVQEDVVGSFVFELHLGNPCWKRQTSLTYPPWNQEFAPENGWFEYDRFLFSDSAQFQVQFAVSVSGSVLKKNGSCSTPPLSKLLLPAGLEPSHYRLVEAKLPVMVFIEGGGFLVPWVHVKRTDSGCGYCSSFFSLQSCFLLGPHLFGINLIQKFSPSLLLFTSRTFSTTTYSGSQRLHRAKLCFKGAFDFPGPDFEDQYLTVSVLPEEDVGLCMESANCFLPVGGRALEESAPTAIQAPNSPQND